MANGNGSRPIRTTIIGPSMPVAYPAIRAFAIEEGDGCDRVLVPWDLVEHSSVVRKAIMQWAGLYLNLHEGERVRMITLPGRAKVAGEIADAWFAHAKRNKIPMTLRDIRVLPLVQKERPTALVKACGDGRPPFWRSLDAIHRHYGAPRVITPPGGDLWLRDNPEVAAEFAAWEHEQKLPLVVALHGGCEEAGGGCGYRKARGFSGTCAEERDAALTECTDPQVEYLWQPGCEDKAPFEVLRPRLG